MASAIVARNQNYKLPPAPTTTATSVQAAPSAPAQTPSFQPPAPVTDPKIAALIAQLTKQQQPTYDQPNAQIADLTGQIKDAQNSQSTVNSGINAQSGQLKALMAELMAGRGPKIGDVSNDPAAVAYDVAARRAAEEARAGEAARLGASGVAGSGDFDARLAQIREATGQDVAGFKANLANERQGQATQTAVTGAGLQLADLERQGGLAASESASKTGNLQNLLNTMVQQEQFGRSQKQQQGQFETQSTQALLAQLLGEQGRTQAQAQGGALTAEELRRQELDRQLATGQAYKPPAPFDPRAKANTYGGRS